MFKKKLLFRRNDIENEVNNRRSLKSKNIIKFHIIQIGKYKLKEMPKFTILENSSSHIVYFPGKYELCDKRN